MISPGSGCSRGVSQFATPPCVLVVRAVAMKRGARPQRAGRKPVRYASLPTTATPTEGTAGAEKASVSPPALDAAAKALRKQKQLEAIHELCEHEQHVASTYRPRAPKAAPLAAPAPPSEPAADAVGASGPPGPVICAGTG